MDDLVSEELWVARVEDAAKRLELSRGGKAGLNTLIRMNKTDIYHLQRLLELMESVDADPIALSVYPVIKDKIDRGYSALRGLAYLPKRYCLTGEGEEGRYCGGQGGFNWDWSATDIEGLSGAFQYGVYLVLRCGERLNHRSDHSDNDTYFLQELAKAKLRQSRVPTILDHPDVVTFVKDLEGQKFVGWTR